MLALCDTLATDVLSTVRNSWESAEGDEHQRCFLGMLE